MDPLFTIGHSNRELVEFLDLLEEYDVTAIADVRSHPRSPRYPHFDSQPLEAALDERAIAYVFLGEELGARRREQDCYAEGRVDFERVAKLPVFQHGLDRVRRGAADHRVALMCAEKDPLRCHRSLLVCRRLRSEFEITHVLKTAEHESQQEMESRLLELTGLPTRSLFENLAELVDRAYDLHSEKIAYRRV